LSFMDKIRPVKLKKFSCGSGKEHGWRLQRVKDLIELLL
jgi:hypothetical protein